MTSAIRPRMHSTPNARFPHTGRTLATYVLADNFFSSVMGPSFPNHLFTIFGTSFGSVDNPRHGQRIFGREGVGM